MTTLAVKLEKCEVCNDNKAKYTCPKCEVRTCCLTCVNIHKKELDCDGVRNKTKFVQLKSFTDLDLLSDYRLLEEVGKSVDKLQRDPLKKYTRQNILPMHLQKLKTAAQQRKVNLLLMPQHFIRHTENTTYLNWKTGELFWRVEWVFPQADNVKCITERALDTTRLSTLLEEILEPSASMEMKSQTEELNSMLNDRLQYYRAAGLSGVKVLLEREKTMRSSNRYHELDLTLPLTENLKRKTIIEFPTFYVILKHHSDMYQIIDSDEENQTDESSISSQTSHNRKRVRTRNKEASGNKNIPVNYFFDMELTGSEDEAFAGTS